MFPTSENGVISISARDFIQLSNIQRSMSPTRTRTAFSVRIMLLLNSHSNYHKNGILKMA